MKKLLFISAIALMFAACEGPEGPMGPQGLPGQNGQDGQNGRDGKDGQNGQNGRDGRDGEGTNWLSIPITVTADEWVLKGGPGDLNSYFVAYKPLKELSKYIYDKGSVIAYIETDRAKHGMPFVLHMGAAENGQEFLWTQTYDFDFMPGEIGFYVSYSDFETSIKPAAETFHVVILWP